MFRYRPILLVVLLLPIAGYTVSGIAITNSDVLIPFTSVKSSEPITSSGSPQTYDRLFTSDHFIRPESGQRSIPDRVTIDLEFENIDRSYFSDADLLQDYSGSTYQSDEDFSFTSDKIQGGYKNHGPINIDGNKEFRKYSGKGTASDPYIIQWYNFIDRSGKNNNLIQIQNTDVYFIIYNNRFTDATSSHVGIVLSNVRNGMIQFNEFSNNDFGIHITNSQDIIIDGNGISLNVFDGISIRDSTGISVLDTNVQSSEDGLSIESSDGLIIEGNTFANNTQNGIYLNQSNSNQIINNIVADNELDGIFLENSNSNLLDLNTIYGNGADQPLVSLSKSGTLVTMAAGFVGSGIWLDPSNDNNITDNIIYDNSGNGIFLEDSANNQLLNNFVFSNDIDGVFLENSDGNTIVGNTVHDNGGGGALQAFSSISISAAGVLGSGIWLDPSNGNTISDNIIYDNLGNGVFLDDSSNNVVDYNMIFSNDVDGIFLQNAHSNNITDNTITDNGNLPGLKRAFSIEGINIDAVGFVGSGIWLDPSDGNVITGNTITGNAANGVYLEDSNNNDVSGNTISDNDVDGVFLQNANSNTIDSNTIFSNGPGKGSIQLQSTANGFTLDAVGFVGSGIWLDPSSDNSISNNIIYDNAANGVYLELSTENNVTDNNIYSNDIDGVFLLGSDSNIISNNSITDNGFGFQSLGLGLDTVGFIGSGIFLDPSNDNVVSNNYVANNAGNGVALEGSSGNTISSNVIDGNGYATGGLLSLDAVGFVGSGIWLDPSDGNTIENNNVTNNAENGIYLYESDNNIVSGNNVYLNDLNGISLQNSSYNYITSNAIDSNGIEVSGLNLEAVGFVGSGIWLDPSEGNVVELNNVTNNAENGLFVIDTNSTVVSENRFFDNGEYGVNLNNGSWDNNATGNNFDGNSFGQARDDGFNNQFFTNFWADHDNNDTDYDGISDIPYIIDGNASNTDAVPSNIPNGINFANFSATIVPTKINAESEGTPVTAKIELSDGFRVLNITLDKIWLNGTINPYEYHIIDILRFTVTFNRSEVNNLINSLNQDPPFFVVLEVTGIINDGLLIFWAYDTVEINQDEDPLPLTLIFAPIAPVAIGEIIRKKSKKAGKST
ncbi:MAG: right-handed parallel beta-helix repeat-containing protein [Candidatus Kariarchaeaceae archaeon]|jgi:parallel beta-helix repeat protein